MILAGIDIGTNTFRLLVAETGPDTFRELYSDRKITRLGQNLERTGKLSHDAEERSIAALIDFSTQIRRHSAIHTAAVGTSALRKAANAAEFIREVKQRTGLDVAVITGEDEARLTLLGVARALRGVNGEGKVDPLESALVVDIGGGSTELILPRPDSEPMAASLPLGAVYLTERFIRSDPPTETEITMLRHAVRDGLHRQDAVLRHGEGVHAAPARIFIGTAGTITTLAAMDMGLADYDPDKINGYTLTGESIKRIVHLLGVSTLKERRNMPGLEQGREDIILAGAMVALEIMDRYGYSEMLVSDWGLREGIVLDLYEKLGKDKHQITNPK